MTNEKRALSVEFPEDIATIRQKCYYGPDTGDKEIEILWKAFSRSACAGWLNVTDEWIKLFEQWLDE